MQNLYDLLGVRPDDDAETLKKAFRRAAKASHPDHHDGDPQAAARFRQVSEAYEILRDPEQRAAYDGLLEFERSPFRHKLKQSLSDMKRHVVRDLAAVVVLATVLVAGFEWFVGIPETSDDGAAVVAARESGQPAPDHPVERIGAAEIDRLKRAPVPQMPIVMPAVPAANDHDRPEGANGGPTSNPTGQTMAVASRESEPDLPASAAIPGKTAGEPPVPHAPSLDAPSSPEQERNGASTSDDRRDGKTPEPAGVVTADVTPLESTGVHGKTESGPPLAHDAPSPDNSSSAVRSSAPAADDRRDGKTSAPAGANAGSVKPPETKPPETNMPAPAAAKRHAPRRPIQQAGLENTRAPDDTPTRAPDNAPDRVFGVGF